MTDTDWRYIAIQCYFDAHINEYTCIASYTWSLSAAGDK